MGRTDYIVTAGVGFDLDRSSAKNTIGGFEAVASTLNAVSTKKAAEGFAKNEAVYQKSLNKISKANKKADEDLVKGVAQSAKSAQASIQKSMPKPLSPAKAAKMSTKELKAYNTAFKASMKGMSKSYGKFAKEAEKLGIKVTKAGGFGKGKSVSDFSKKDVETRKRLINLTERMAKSEKEKLDGIKKGTKAYLKQKAEVEALERQHKDMKNLNEDIMQQERKTGKIKSKNAKKERQAEKKKGAADKAVIQRQKVIAQGLQRIGKVASMTAGKISSGLKNAFVIGTAAAAAFFYKMQPLAETVQEFEKTIINANSVFNETREVLHSVSDEMVRFTLKYGVSAQDMATGLYQLASAGLTAAESQEVLQHTMKLAMATQGDHNALAKLTVQTIMGFGMEMSDSAELVDKFAHSIQKSLIEWEDLASSVKFAMPFFVATGQSVDELLGGLEVLTNRALEAGIAGRGLRQALAQFAKHADDNASAMRKLGIDIMDTEGNMRALHEIALDASAAFGDVTDLEALTIMLEDMNVRGATAFALLVQNADEFEAAVGDISNAAGSATKMADIQQESLALQIQRVKNALMAPFLLSDKIGEANDTLNEFTYNIKLLVDEFVGFFIIEMADGTMQLNAYGDTIKSFVVEALKEFLKILQKFKKVFLESSGGLENLGAMLHLALIPLNIILDVLDALPAGTLKWLMMLKVLNSILPITHLWTMLNAAAQAFYSVAVSSGEMKVKAATAAMWNLNMAMMSTVGAMALLVAAGYYFRDSSPALLAVIGALTGAFIAAGVAKVFFAEAKWGYGAVAAAVSAGAIMGALVISLGAKIGRTMHEQGMTTAGVAAAPEVEMPTEQMYDSGGTYLGMRDNGGPTTEHGMAILQKGETVIPKTRNMLEGGVTLNIGGDIVTNDAEDFAERIAEALPQALRRVNDGGGF